MINYDESVISYNKQAMNALKSNQKSVAYNLLSQAESLLKSKPIQNPSRLQTLTYNNFGCLHKRSGDYHLSLKFFTKALNQQSSDPLNKAGVLLNLCNVYSLLINHQKALSSALQALELLQTVQDSSETYNFTLLTAYQSIAMEQENLSQYEVAKSFYKKALKFAIKWFPEGRAVEKIRDRIEVLIGKIQMCKGEIGRGDNRVGCKKVYGSLTPSLEKSKKKVERLTLMNHTAVYKKIKSFGRKVQLLKERKLERRIFGRNGYGEESTERERESSSRRNRGETSFPGSRKGRNKQMVIKMLKKHSKTPEIFPIAFKTKLSFMV